MRYDMSQENQVVPFSLETADGQTLFAWHILPLPLYAQHEDSLIKQPSGLCNDITQTENFKLLRQDPNSRLVIYCWSPTRADRQRLGLTIPPSPRRENNAFS